MINLPIGYFHAVLLAVHDLIHADATLAECFGAVALAGTVTVAPLGTTVTGTGTDFERDLSEGQRVDIVGQVGYVETINNSTSLELAAAHVAGATDVTILRAAQIHVLNFPDPLPMGPPYCIVTGGPVQPVEAGVGTRTLDPVVEVHYLTEIAQAILTDSAPSLWDVGDRLARVLSAPGVPGVRSAAYTLCVPRFGQVQLAAGVNPVSLGITGVAADGLYSHGWEFTYKSISQPLEVASANQPLW